MSQIIFFADTHLNISQPGKTQRIIEFLRSHPADTSFYILGDFLDLWIGPKHLELVDYKTIFAELNRLTARGVQINFIPGNRDFQVGPEITSATGIQILPEVVDLTLNGRKIMLTHGDIFCTEDKSYQTYRRISRSKIVKSVYQSLPQNIGLGLGKRMRGYSQEVVPKKPALSHNIVASILLRYFRRGFDTIICGHIHNPQIKEIAPGKTLITVGSWERNGSYVKYENGKFSLEEVTK